ncbi:PI-actitoxin-Avd5a-like [Ruditapes philippinarum]|uniref:PI-actitoxin-Avd5a-like n=1 Tax=Ruditapes philippinarum TaxID=129788 RepID=UPI00295AA43C|nr:PI-actitoxin-Avd5a-like [Ruditapes philippinarum]
MLVCILFCCLVIQSVSGHDHQNDIPDADCNQICIAIGAPVCGSDGKTYGHACEFNIGQCKNEELKLSHTGPCPVQLNGYK